MFQYPGGKSHLADKIINLMPDHECFVEGFGGSAALTLSKPKVEVNVYNDLDSELVHFFTVFREEPERLIQRVKNIPYSSEWYEEAAPRFYNGELPGDTLVGGREFKNEVTDDHVVRAAVFFALRYMQWGAKYQGKSGFGRSKVQNGAETFANARERLEEFVGYWSDITIENVSYSKLADSYDSEKTFWYFDPPYIGTEGYYRESDFSHQKFCNHIEQLDGYWMVSYDEVPAPLKDYYIIQEDSTNFIDSGVKGEGKDTVESFILNYDPDDVRRFSSQEQAGWGELSGGGSSGTDDNMTSDTTTASMWDTDEESEETNEGWLDDAI